MQNFFQHQDVARFKTAKLLTLYVGLILLLSLGVVVLFSALLIFIGAIGDSGQGVSYARLVTVAFWRDAFWLALTMHPVIWGIMVIMILTSVISYLRLGSSAAGAKVAESMGARLITTPDHPSEQRLMNIVQEVALAAGVPVPGVYVLDDPMINAFAAGKRMDSAVVAVTQGALDQLSRAELQGVIAHEFSHITNGDMTLNIRVLALLKGLMAIALIGELLMRGSRRDARIVLAGILLIILGWMGVWAGRMVQAAVSRQREHLADATAIQYTRSQLGIAGALRKISLQNGEYSAGRQKKGHSSVLMTANSHFMFSKPFSVKSGFLSRATGLGKWMSTHPDIFERLDRVLPDWRQREASQVTPAVVKGGSEEGVSAGLREEKKAAG
ncbi:M48 family metalloprotease [Marinobacterium sp. BA1]|uniref:M48 family metalloprotease n=1 Tax=Marinobacterium sp. BA1 TaxID=3138931 RepID=UPI0032E6C0E7